MLYTAGALGPEQPLAQLTERECEVLGLMAEGRSNAAIAAQLVVTPRTVEAHIRQILSKLDLNESPDDHRRVLAVPRTCVVDSRRQQGVRT